MYNCIRKIVIRNKFSQYTYIEPFAGGANVALNLLYNKDIKKIHINDYDRSIYAFWYSILNFTEDFVKKVMSIELSIEEWKNQRKIQGKKNDADIFELGFSTFYLNRTNRSGIISAGAIGGKHQKGDYDLSSRFNRLDLIHRIITISKMKHQITVSNMDARELLEKYIDEKKVFWYLDPPYYNKGADLYMNFYTHSDHILLRDRIINVKRIVISYDDTKEIREIFKDFKSKKYSLIHNVSNKGNQREIMFFSNDIIVPSNLYSK